MDDLIRRKDAIDAPEKFIKDCNPEHFVWHQKFIEYMDNAEIGSFGNWQFANGFNMGLTAAEVAIKELPSAQAESCEDAVSRKYAIEHYQHVCRRTSCKECPLHIQVTDTLTDCELELFLHNLPSVQPEQRWIPVKTRPMDEEEKQSIKPYLEEHYGYTFGEDYDGIMFDCPMPEDGQEVWVCSKCGNVWQDTCDVDEGIGLEENGDWDDIVAWMPFERPKPYKEEEE